MKLTLHTFLTIDGVMQGPGAPDEDRSGGFDRGGWLTPFFDEDLGQIVNGWFSETDAILIGRTTYDMMFRHWSKVDDPSDRIATALNNRPKYIASRTMTDAQWTNSTVITGDVIRAVGELKKQPGRELQIHGSCLLAQTLHDAGLIDEYRLLLFPVVVGHGKRLFRDGSVPSTFEMVGSPQVAASGAVAHTFRPTGVSASSRKFDVVDGKSTIVRAAG